MELDEKVSAPQKTHADEDYLNQLSSKQARNAAFVAIKLGVTPATVARRLAKDAVKDKVLTRFKANEPFFVLKPQGKAKSAGVEI